MLCSPFLAYLSLPNRHLPFVILLLLVVHFPPYISKKTLHNGSRYGIPHRFYIKLTVNRVTRRCPCVKWILQLFILYNVNHNVTTEPLNINLKWSFTCKCFPPHYKHSGENGKSPHNPFNKRIIYVDKIKNFPLGFFPRDVMVVTLRKKVPRLTQWVSFDNLFSSLSLKSTLPCEFWDWLQLLLNLVIMAA